MMVTSISSLIIQKTGRLYFAMTAKQLIKNNFLNSVQLQGIVKILGVGTKVIVDTRN